MYRSLLFFILLCVTFTNGAKAQGKWDEEAELFVEEGLNKYESYTLSEIQLALEKSTKFISAFGDSCSTLTLSNLYLLRADLRFVKLNIETESFSNTYIPPAESIDAAEIDYKNAFNSCGKCECEVLKHMLPFYYSYREGKPLDSLKKVVKAMGMPADHTYLGLDASYNPNKNIIGAELGILGAWTILQPKKWTNAKGEKYRKCNYEYPMAVGLFFVGYETSLYDQNYRALKINPFWFKRIFSLHPFQMLYANWNGKRTFIYRPEIGFAFSTFAIDYAYNLSFKKSFDFLSPHTITIRVCIPTLKFWND